MSNGKYMSDRKVYEGKIAAARIWGEIKKNSGPYRISLYGLADPGIHDSVPEMDSYLAFIQSSLELTSRNDPKREEDVRVFKSLIDKRDMMGLDAGLITGSYGAAIDRQRDEQALEDLRIILDNFVRTMGFCYIGLSDETFEILRNPDKIDQMGGDNDNETYGEETDPMNLSDS